MYTAKQLLEYRSKLSIAIIKKSPDIYFNDSILHAMIVMKELFDKAKKEGQKKVCMYCGQFSLFRDDIQDKIEREKKKCSIEELTETERIMWEKVNFFDDLRHSFLDFLKEPEAIFELILQNYSESIQEMTLWRELTKEILSSKVKVYRTNYDVVLEHFVTTAEAYRIENSNMHKTATCCFYDKENALILNDCFKELQRKSQRIEL